MASTPAEGRVIGGVDTHQDLHTAAVVTLEGKVLGSESFSTTRAGYRAMLAWFRAHGELLRVGVESTGIYGAGIARLLAVSGVPVLEVTGPDPAARRARGKDDALEAVAAAEAARTGCRVQIAKDRGGAMEALRVLRTTRKTAVKSRRAALQQLHNTVAGAPDEVRDRIRDLTRMRRLRACAAWRPDATRYRDPEVATRLSLKSLARRILALDEEIAALDRSHRSARRGTRSRSARPRRRGRRQRGRADGRRRRKPRPAALRGELRDAVRRLPAARIERERRGAITSIAGGTAKPTRPST